MMTNVQSSIYDRETGKKGLHEFILHRDRRPAKETHFKGIAGWCALK